MIWGVLMGVGLGGLLAASYRWWLAIPFLLKIAMFSFFVTEEFHGSMVTEDIWREAPNHIPLTYTAIAVASCLPITGSILNLRRRAEVQS
jgi:hypothetical protein